MPAAASGCGGAVMLCGARRVMRHAGSWLPPDAAGAGAPVAGCRLVRTPRIADPRGVLVFAEAGGLLPFVPRRYFLIHDAPEHARRGGHAHHALHEFLVAARGWVEVDVDDGRVAATARLDSPDIGLHIPPLTWGSMHFGPGAVLLVFASAEYDPESYIRNRVEFERLVHAH